MFNPFDLVALFEKCPNITKAVLFGSRATSEHDENSDVDIAIYGDISPSEFDELTDKLDSVGSKKKFDLIMYNMADAELRQIIDEKGLTIYERGLKKHEPVTDGPVWVFEAQPQD